MGRPTGSKNRATPQKNIEADEAERLEYIAALLMEIAEEELRQSEATACNQI